MFKKSWIFPESRSFVGKFVKIIPIIVDEDVDDLYNISHEPDSALLVWNYLPQGPFYDIVSFRVHIDDLVLQKDRIPFIVRRTEDNMAVGTISIMRIVAKDGVAELGNIWYAPAAQRTATNTEAVYLLLGYLFDELGYRRVEWKCDSRNVRSSAAALRLGFTFEGCFRQHMVIKQENRDTLWYAMLDQEWKEKKVNFEQTLYASDYRSLSQLNETPR